MLISSALSVYVNRHGDRYGERRKRFAGDSSAVSRCTGSAFASHGDPVRERDKRDVFLVPESEAIDASHPGVTVMEYLEAPSFSRQAWPPSSGRNDLMETGNHRGTPMVLDATVAPTGHAGTEAALTADRVNAVVLAGGINSIPLYPGYTPGYKALVPFQGRPSILYVLDALSAVPRVGRVCITGPESDLRPALEGTRHGGDACDFAAGGETLRESIVNGIEHFAPSSRVLVLTADQPLVTPRAIAAFLAACDRIPAPETPTLYLSVVPRRCFTGPYTHFTKPFNRFRDIEVCHGNLWLADSRLLHGAGATDRISRIYRGRKNPAVTTLRVGLRVGLAYLIGVHLLHALTLKQMIRIAARCYGVGCVPVIVEHPEIAMDVDEPADYRFVVEQLNRCG
jgi:CTP:molybdopterin cytidylyltransferase MocA